MNTNEDDIITETLTDKSPLEKVCQVLGMPTERKAPLKFQISMLEVMVMSLAKEFYSRDFKEQTLYKVQTNAIYFYITHPEIKLDVWFSHQVKTKTTWTLKKNN